MPPILGLSLGCLCTFLFLRIDSRRGEDRISKALWIPTFWLLIVTSRPVSLWFAGSAPEQGAASPAEAFADGSPFDRNVFLALILLGVCALVFRRVEWSGFVRKNAWILLYATFGLVSILLWSDVKLFAFKHWVKLGGHIVMATIIATEMNPTEALRRTIARVTYTLVPLSIVLIKYYPQYGIGFDPFSGAMYFVGVTNHKNELGTLCMLAALFLVWSWTSRRSKSTTFQRFLRFASYLVFGGMVVWTLHKADSGTDTVTAVFGAFSLVVLSSLRGSWIMRWLTQAVVGFLVLMATLYFTGIIDMFILAIGEDLTFTGRTVLWAELLAGGTNPIIGSGFESFWLGPVAAELWRKYWWHPIQAHDGFIETYLNLGVVGLTLICGYVLHVYVTSIQRMRSEEFDLGRFTLTFLLVALFYNVTEAAFGGMGVMWVMLVFCGVTHTSMEPARAQVPLASRPPRWNSQLAAVTNTRGMNRNLARMAMSR